jgi:hypothetical protein
MLVIISTQQRTQAQILQLVEVQKQINVIRQMARNWQIHHGASFTPINNSHSNINNSSNHNHNLVKPKSKHQVENEELPHLVKKRLALVRVPYKQLVTAGK